MQSRVEDLDISTDGTDYARRLNIATCMFCVHYVTSITKCTLFLSKFPVRAAYALVSIMF